MDILLDSLCLDLWNISPLLYSGGKNDFLFVPLIPSKLRRAKSKVFTHLISRNNDPISLFIEK